MPGDSKKRVSRKYWPTHIYDYNYKVSEGYYNPQKEFMDTTSVQRYQYSPPKHQTYAERFASNPWYGEKRGLPYVSSDQSMNALSVRPAERPRSSSLIRNMRQDEHDDIPMHIRASRRRRKFEDEEEKLGIRGRPNSFDSREYKLSPRYKDVSDKLRSLDAELVRLAPRRTSVTENLYSSESYNDSSKPPISPRVRTTSFNEEFAKVPPMPRSRIGSVGDLPPLPRSRRTSITEDEDTTGSYAGRSGRIREERRLNQSREMTDGISNLVEKMRASRLNVEDAYIDRKDKGRIPHRIDNKLYEDQKHNKNFVFGASRRY